MKKKRYYDPYTDKRITKSKALGIALKDGVMVVRQEMTLEEARKQGYKI